jgi:hypothetical protein
VSENPKVYTACTIELGDDDGYENSRVVGLFTEKADAVAAIERNACDMYEHGYYKYAVVEVVRLNVLYPVDTEEPIEWYVWQGDCETGGYKSVPCPKMFERIRGFGF